MHVPLLPLRVAAFRCRFFAYVVLIAFVGAFLPSVSLAQQATATVNQLTGTVLLNGQPASLGNTLRAGDVIETGAGASVVLDLSDGSQLELAENTRLDLSQLLETSDGVRVLQIPPGQTEAEAPEPGSPGTKAVIGAGLALAVGGVALAVGGSGDSGGKTENFTGRFEGSETGDNYSWTKIIELTQTDSSLSGTLIVYEAPPDCQCNLTTGLSGEVTGDNRAEAYAYDQYVPCKCSYGADELPLPHPLDLRLQDGGNTLFIGGEWGIFLQRVQ